MEFLDEDTLVTSGSKTIFSKHYSAEGTRCNMKFRDVENKLSTLGCLKVCPHVCLADAFLGKAVLDLGNAETIMKCHFKKMKDPEQK